jgi:hypothetical protein
MKWWTDHMHVSGVNFHIPHSFNPRAPYDRDCPPYFYHGGYEPRWPLYRVYADYTSRLSLMLSGGRHVCPVALLFNGNIRQVGKAIPPEPLTDTLQDMVSDCDWLPFDIFENEARLFGNEVCLHSERYQVLVVPPVEAIPYGVLLRAKEFLDKGGIVVGYGFLPTKSATLGKTSADIARLRGQIWGQKANPNDGRAFFLPEQPTAAALRAIGVPSVVEVLDGDTGHGAASGTCRAPEPDVGARRDRQRGPYSPAWRNGVERATGVSRGGPVCVSETAVAVAGIRARAVRCRYR